MKRYVVIMVMVTFCFRGFSQAQEAQQLLLNAEKLAQLKQILSDMKKGYEVVSKGYTKIKDISKGNFKLHETFLDKMLQVSPTVRNYKRVADIIRQQKQIISEHKAAFQKFKASNLFNDKEIRYLTSVYDGLVDRSLENLNELAMVITASKLRMSDEERIKAIDRIFSDMEDKLVFLRSFNKRTNVLAMQRFKEKREVEVSRRLNGVK
jgi:hypothetical protein